jgi:hypothetical protein
MPTIPINSGENITAAQFNELVQLYNAYWQGGVYTYADTFTTEIYTGTGTSSQTYTVQQPLGAPDGWFVKTVVRTHNGSQQNLPQHIWEVNGQILSFVDPSIQPQDGTATTITIANSHITEVARRKGWGQPAVIPTVAQTTIITAEHTNYLLAQINAGLWHIEEDVSSLQVKRGASTSVLASIYEALESLYNNVIEPKKFNIDPSSKNVNNSIVTTGNNSTPWQSDLYSEHKFVFTGYNAARHFFNSGGELIVDMSSTSGGTNQPSMVWNAFFDNLGIVRIGAETTTNDGDSENDVPYTSVGGAKGFYNIPGVDNGASPTNSDWQTIYNVAADNAASGGEYGSEYGSAYGGSYSGGIYSQRRFIIDIRGTINTTTNNFEVHLKVKLIEDDDDGAMFVNANIVGEFGYAQPLETPIASESSTHQFFSPVAGVDYVFLERAAPTISMVETWTAVNYLGVTITGV